jgi:hypothetical protein
MGMAVLPAAMASTPRRTAGSRPLERLLQGLVGLVDLGGPLHGQALFRFARVGELVRMDLRLDVPVGLVQPRRIQGKCLGQAEQVEVVAG